MKLRIQNNCRRESKSKLYFFILLLLLAFACKEPVDFGSYDIKLSDISSESTMEAPLKIAIDKGKKHLLNGERLSLSNNVLELSEGGFYTLEIDDNQKLLFVLLDPERGDPEWGLKKHVPELPVLSENIGEYDLYYPKNLPQNIQLPIVLRNKNWTYLNPDYFKVVFNQNKETLVKRGAGSLTIPMEENGKVEIRTDFFEESLQIGSEFAETVQLNGPIDHALEIGANTLIITNTNLQITSAGSLTINEGCVWLLAEGVNVVSQGPISFQGSEEQAIFVTSDTHGQAFGGFINETSKATVAANWTIFSHFGYHTGEGYQYGHARRQALFKSENTTLNFNNCFFIDTESQVFYPESSEIALHKCLVQRAKTAGQTNRGHITVTESYFSDFPDDSQQYRDEDNDALYLSSSDADISNSVFMYAKDDGIDSGSGEGGIVNLENIYISSCFHEGFALSGSKQDAKIQTLKSCIVEDCQQGIELGFSNSLHVVSVHNCHLKNNYIGIRLGDNYENGVNGTMHVYDCTFENNEKDIWNMIHKFWEPGEENLIIH